MHILLTGAAGFVGKQLLGALKQQKMIVRAVSRSTDPSLAQADDVVIKNLTQHSDFKNLLSKVDMVIHLADGFNAYEQLPASITNDEAARRLQTTIALANEAAQKGAHIIYLSTIKTMCGVYADHVLNEASATKPQSLYGKLKLEAEQAILKASQQHGTRAIILRFPIVFGPDVGGNMEKLRRLADSSIPLPLLGLNNKRSLISSHSLIDAVLTILKCQQEQGGVYLVHDGALSTPDMIRLVRQAGGRPQRQFGLPPALWPSLEKLPLVGPKLLRFTHSLEIDDHLFRQTFGWQPPKPLQEALKEWAKGHQTDRAP